jgi:hypothetical protein
MNKLWVNRIGSNNEAYMKTISIVNTFNKYSKVIWKNNNLEISEKPITIKGYKLSKPKRLRINIKLIENTDMYIESDNNILGKNSIMLIDVDLLKIPVEIATHEKLNYYLCDIIDNGDVFNLNNNTDISCFNIKIGSNYLDDYILQPKLGDGLYIETHDKPHFHQPLNADCSGYLLLAKIKRDELIITAFKIPYGKAVYIPSYVLHCDACLVGDYNVIYSLTENYKTYLIYNELNEKMVHVQFIDNN